MLRRPMNLVAALGLASGLLLASPRAFGHCEIPCGIYTDVMRFDMLTEHIATIEKSVQQIVELQKDPAANINQLVRWVQNKDEHADHVQEIVTQYFLTQRVKADHPMYGDQLKLLHGMLVHAMKAKQTTDLAPVAALREHLAKYREIYLGKEGEAHAKEHAKETPKEEPKK